MGLALIARLARAGVPQAEAYANLAATMQLHYSSHFQVGCSGLVGDSEARIHAPMRPPQDPRTGLYFHGDNAATGSTSCCFWSRANGWQLSECCPSSASSSRKGHSSSDGPAPPPRAPRRRSVRRRGAPRGGAGRAVVAAHPAAAGWLQEPRGRDDCRAGRRRPLSPGARGQGTGARGQVNPLPPPPAAQVVNDSSTFLETSATAMATYALCTAVTQGWLPRAAYDEPIQRAWGGLAAQVQSDGSVNGICEGTGKSAAAILECLTYARTSRPAWRPSPQASSPMPRRTMRAPRSTTRRRRVSARCCVRLSPTRSTRLGRSSSYGRPSESGSDLQLDTSLSVSFKSSSRRMTLDARHAAGVEPVCVCDGFCVRPANIDTF